MSEQRTQKKILDWLKAEGHWAVKTITCNKNGTPDILCCVNGHFVGIEVKTPTGRVAPIQEYQIKKIRESGGKAFVARSLEEVVDIVNTLP